jgi:pSer/pThr/pTyr-binding forkhead associated (FHA) protein
MSQQPPRPGPFQRPADRPATLIETDEGVREALQTVANARRQGVVPAPAPTEPVPASPPRPGPVGGIGQAARPYRPTARPPVPILTVHDDGRTEGEAIRLRTARFVIGRTEGDLQFPLDGRMSARHVEITYQLIDGAHRWIVTDLQSMHGLFVRVSRTVLADRAEFLVGSGRYRFESGQPPRTEVLETIRQTPEAALDETQHWPEGTGTVPLRPAAVTELLGRETGNRTLLVKPDYWIGTDPTCPICRPDDPFCEPRHARIFQGKNEGWRIEHNKTQNGLWLRMAQVTVDAMIQFQAGEQRFRLKVN